MPSELHMSYYRRLRGLLQVGKRKTRVATTFKALPKYFFGIRKSVSREPVRDGFQTRTPTRRNRINTTLSEYESSLVYDADRHATIRNILDSISNIFSYLGIQTYLHRTISRKTVYTRFDVHYFVEQIELTNRRNVRRCLLGSWVVF